MPVQIHNGKVLIVDDLVANHADCCCCECDPDVLEYQIEVYYEDSDGVAGDLTTDGDFNVTGSLCDDGGLFELVSKNATLEWNGSKWSGTFDHVPESGPDEATTFDAVTSHLVYTGSTDRCDPVGIYRAAAEFQFLYVEVSLP